MSVPGKGRQERKAGERWQQLRRADGFQKSPQLRVSTSGTGFARLPMVQCSLSRNEGRSSPTSCNMNKLKCVFLCKNCNRSTFHCRSAELCREGPAVMPQLRFLVPSEEGPGSGHTASFLPQRAGECNEHRRPAGGSVTLQSFTDGLSSPFFISLLLFSSSAEV